MSATSLSIGDQIRYRENIAGNKYRTREGIIIDETDRLYIIDLGRYRDTILKSDLKAKLLKVQFIRKGEGDMSVKIEPPSAEYLAALFEANDHNIYKTAKKCEPQVSAATMSKWLREAAIIPAKTTAHNQAQAPGQEDPNQGNTENKLPVSEEASPALAEISERLSRLEEYLDMVARRMMESEKAMSEPNESDHLVIKKVVDFALAPIDGRIDKIEESVASLAGMIIALNDKQSVSAKDQPEVMDLLAQLVIHILRRVTACESIAS